MCLLLPFFCIYISVSQRRLPGPGALALPGNWLENRSLDFILDRLNQWVSVLNGVHFETLSPWGKCYFPASTSNRLGFREAVHHTQPRWWQEMAWKIFSHGCPLHSSSVPPLCLLCNMRQTHIPHGFLHVSPLWYKFGSHLQGCDTSKGWNQDSKVVCSDLILILSSLFCCFLRTNYS